MNESIQKIINDGLSKIRPFPSIVHSALDLIDKSDCDAGLLSDVLKKDPVLSARLLSIANSPFYGVQKEIADVESACVILGHNIIRTILVSAAALESFPVTKVRKNIWTHSLEVATVSQLIAKKIKAEGDKAYLAGLLHDVGKFLLIDLFPDKTELIESYTSEKCESKLEDKDGFLSINHAELGSKIIAAWKLHVELQDLIENHHSPLESENPVLCSILNLSDDICHQLSKGLDDNVLVSSLEEKYLNALNVEKSGVADMLSDIKIKISELDGAVEKLG